MNFAISAFARRAAIAILAVFAMALPQTVMAQGSVLTGIFNFVPARSTVLPASQPKRYKSATLTVSGNQMIIEGIDAQDKPVKITFDATVDGKPHPVVGINLYDSATFSRFSDTRATYNYMKGKTSITLGVRVLSADGNTLTFSEKTYNATGKEMNAQVMIFAKPGFEVAVVAPPVARVGVPLPVVGAGDTPDEKAAIEALGAGNDDEAIRLFTRAIMTNSPQANIHYALVSRGIAYSRKNQTEEAMKDFDAAIKLKPDDPEAHYRRGGLLVGMKRFDDAILALDVAIKGDDMNATAYFLRGYSYNSLTKDVPGAADKAKACELDKMYCE